MKFILIFFSVIILLALLVILAVLIVNKTMGPFIFVHEDYFDDDVVDVKKLKKKHKNKKK